MFTPLLIAIEKQDFEETIGLIGSNNSSMCGQTKVFEEDKYRIYPVVPLANTIDKFFGNELVLLVKLMLEDGASFHTEGWCNYGMHNSIDMAIKRNCLDVLKLFDCSGSKNYIEYAIKEGANLDIIKYLYSIDEEICSQRKRPEEYLLQSCQHNYRSIKFFAEKSHLTKELVSKCLFEAIIWRKGYETIKYLWSLGADPNYSQGNDTYLHYLRDVEFLDILIAGGLDAKLPIHNGAIFHYTHSSNNTIMIEKLLQLDANIVNHRTGGCTPLIVYCYKMRDYGIKKYFSLMQLVYKYGANINAFDNFGDSIVSICAGRNHLDELKIIVEEWGASLTKPTSSTDDLELEHIKKWKDPLAEAKHWKCVDTTKYLEEVYQQRNI